LIKDVDVNHQHQQGNQHRRVVKPNTSVVVVVVGQDVVEIQREDVDFS